MRRSRAAPLPPHVHRVTSRGRSYYYYQPGRSTDVEAIRIRIDGEPSEETWWAQYRALSGTPEPPRRTDTVADLIAAWQASHEWARLAPSTRTNWALACRRIDAAIGRERVRAIDAGHILALRDHYSRWPSTSDNMLRCLSSMLSWSIPRRWRSDNPALSVTKLALSEPWPAWTAREIQFARRWGRPELWWVAALALYTGQRQGDVLAMTWRDVDRGEIHVVQEKTGTRVWIPLHNELAEVLATIPRRATTILTSSDGRPWTPDGFRASWGAQMARRGFRVLVARRRVFHGLRKSAVVALFEAGCSMAEVSAITGQSLRMVEHYAADISKRRLARRAVRRLERSGRVLQLPRAR